ncbi:transporter substrate-binding domain-containing protein [Myxococcota bacterium]|nr:transporter substrate-binding domain-containing protein [Myxococcota bacterium]
MGLEKSGLARARIGRGRRATSGFAALVVAGLALCLLAGCAGHELRHRHARAASPQADAASRVDAHGDAADVDDAVHRIVESGRLRVGLSGAQPPLNMRDREGDLIGLDVDLAIALADAMDLELELIERPFAELLDGLQAGDFDLVISNMTITPARNAVAAFAGPYLISGATLLTRKELAATFESDAAIDSAERTFGVRSGSTSEGLVREAFPKAKVVAVDDLATLLPRVRSGELDGLFSDLPWVRFVLARNPDSGLAEVGTPFTTEPIGIALDPGSPLLANLVQNYLNTLEYTGLLLQMKTYWLSEGKWTSQVAE